ncbi:MAG: hypothetical protein HeimC2_35200 [Candidatus Heimdallarchaeota archaeon LC_2]|nr:MAG: hypothetical protein HeimC2_35200 [Candidatus Heimdallarchaeota archaeon LC_2]
MKITTLIHILLITSLVMLLPLFENSYSTTLFPGTPKSLVINVHTPELKFSSDKLTVIELNVSFMNPLINEATIITPEFFQFSLSKTIKLNKPGSYLLEFFTEEIVEVTVEGVGIYTFTIAIILTLLIIDIILLARNYLLDLEL